MEVALKTRHTEKLIFNSNKLAFGLKKVVKTNLDENHYKLDSFDHIESEEIRDGSIDYK